MGRFIKTLDGYVNLDRVTHIRPSYSSKKAGCTEAFYDSEGVCLGTRVVDSETNFDDEHGPYLPAAQDDHAVVMYGMYEDEGPMEVHVEYPRIIAWNVSKYPTPVFVEPNLNEYNSGLTMVFLMDFDGSLRIPDSMVFKSIEDAKEYAEQYFSRVRSEREAKESIPASAPKRLDVG